MTGCAQKILVVPCIVHRTKNRKNKTKQKQNKKLCVARLCAPITRLSLLEHGRCRTPTDLLCPVLVCTVYTLRMYAPTNQKQLNETECQAHVSGGATRKNFGLRTRVQRRAPCYTLPAYNKLCSRLVSQQALLGLLTWVRRCFLLADPCSILYQVRCSMRTRVGVGSTRCRA